MKFWHLIVLALALLLGVPGGLAKDKGLLKPVKIKKAELSELLFATNAPIRTFKIEVSSNELSALQKDVRAYVRGTFSEGSLMMRDVGLHLKGNGSFQPLNQKPSLAVKFDRFVPDQTYLGLSKIMLNNSGQDGTYLAEFMASWMFRDANVPSPRVTHARVVFNGRDLGLFVCIEAENKEFLKRWFHNHDGNLYENYVKDVDEPMDQDNGADTSQNDLKPLVAAAKTADPQERWGRLLKVLDLDRYLSHLVCEMFTSHSDGYAMNRNNYRVYDDLDTGRFTFIGHGLDWGFANAGMSINPPHNSLITRAVLTTPQGASLYQQRARTLFTNVFSLEVLTNRVNCAAARLVSQARDTNEARLFLGYGNEMRNRLVARHQNLLSQFAAIPALLAFDSSGVARLKDWQKKMNSGAPAQEQARLDSRNVLRICTSTNACVASWRQRVQLPPGKYVFEGDVHGDGIAAIPNDLGEGAGLRISGGKRDNKLVGSAGWTHLKYDINVEGAPREVELVCELRAVKGEVWFDADSLRLVQQR